jgi:hypothetical protein
VLELRSNKKTAGRVIHDPRGNAVWDWAIETGVLAKATVAELIKSLVENHAQPQPIVLELQADEPARGSGDPYNSLRR